MKQLALCLLALSFSVQLIAQDTTNCACCSENHQSFQFWLGEWNVYDTTGNWIGSNSISLEQDSCLMREQWKSNTMTGSSVNFFDTKDGLWRQVWVDNQGGNLFLKGKMEGKSMVMHSELIQGQQGPYLNRITWTPNAKGEVIQRWDILDSQGKLKATVFYGIYRKSGS